MENFIKNNKLVNLLFFYSGSFVVRFLGLFVRVNDKRILLSSGMGKGIFDSPLLIYNTLKNDPFFDDYDMIWAVKDVEKYHTNYTVVKIDTFKYFYYCLTSKVWITSVNIERGLKFKKKQTIYINTWHGVPLKTIGLDVKARHDYDFSHVDMFISSGKYETDIYKRAFHMSDKQIFEIGNPRNIKLYNLRETSAQKRLDQLKMLKLEQYKDKKIILFAPTWRDYDYTPIDLDNVMSNISNDYIVLVKSHPLEKLEFESRIVVDVSHVGDIVDLLPITDILISDYSSVMIDFSILMKPIVAFVPDFDTYNKLRGLYVSKGTLAPNVVVNEDELIHFINHFNLETEMKKTNAYHDFFLQKDPREGMSIIHSFIQEKLRN